MHVPHAPVSKGLLVLGVGHEQVVRAKDFQLDVQVAVVALKCLRKITNRSMHQSHVAISHGHMRVVAAKLSLLKFQDFPIQAKSLRVAALLNERAGKVLHCYRIEVRSVHSCLGSSHLKLTNELLFACRASMVLALAVLVRLHNARHVYKPA